MVIMNVKIDNFFAFKNFNMNMTYPRKINNSYIEDEFLKGHENFRYKKVNILMGANATGKTSFGRMLMTMFNFIEKQESSKLLGCIGDTTQEASFTLDFVVKDDVMYRLDVKVLPKSDLNDERQKIEALTRSVRIGKRDSYETCVEKIEEHQCELQENYIEELNKIDHLGWMFSYPGDTGVGVVNCGENQYYPRILNRTLRALDPSILSVEKINEAKGSYVIHMQDRDLVIQDGEVIKNNILSSGTKSGIDIANMLSAIYGGDCGFYYCDEKFSYAHSDVEKAFLNIMIECLHSNEQLFFTSHNLDVLEMPLPKHAFTFLKKDINNITEPISCIYASDYLKKNTDSLKNAIENDFFSVSPNVDLIFDIINI